MKHLPDDLLRIILAFASPTVGARQLAARARTLDEEVEFRPSNEPENYKLVGRTHAPRITPDDDDLASPRRLAMQLVVRSVSSPPDRRNHIAGRSAMGC